MKIHNFNIVLFILFLFIIGCGGEQISTDSSESESGEDLENATGYELSISDKLAAEKIEHLRDSVEEVKTAISPFLQEGCCNNENQKSEACCCENVYKKYKSMLDKKDPAAVDIGMTDPILANCRKQMPKQFDLLENPPSDKPDELDALFD